MAQLTQSYGFISQMSSQELLNQRVYWYETSQTSHNSDLSVSPIWGGSLHYSRILVSRRAISLLPSIIDQIYVVMKIVW